MKHKHEEYRPGPTWKQVGPCAWKRADGLIVNTGIRICLLPDGVNVPGLGYPMSLLLDWYIRINGGNLKRGVMAWAAAQCRAAKCRAAEDRGANP